MARLSTENETKAWSGKMPDFNPDKEKQEAKTTKVVCHVLETTEVSENRLFQPSTKSITTARKSVLKLVKLQSLVPRYCKMSKIGRSLQILYTK